MLREPVSTNHFYNTCTMLDQCRRRWADAVQMLYKCFVFAYLALEHYRRRCPKINSAYDVLCSLGGFGVLAVLDAHYNINLITGCQ